MLLKITYDLWTITCSTDFLYFSIQCSAFYDLVNILNIADMDHQDIIMLQLSILVMQKSNNYIIGQHYIVFAIGRILTIAPLVPILIFYIEAHYDNHTFRH